MIFFLPQISMSVLRTLTTARIIALTLSEDTSACVMMATFWNQTITHAMVSIGIESVLYHHFLSVDIDECNEGKEDCHSNATCANTEGSYNCTCVYGYSGDGRNCTSKTLKPVLQ